jgi:hypothetical protein
MKLLIVLLISATAWGQQRLCASVDACGYDGSNYVGFGTPEETFQRYSASTPVRPRVMPYTNMQDWLYWQRMEKLEHYAPSLARKSFISRLRSFRTG